MTIDVPIINVLVGNALDALDHIKKTQKSQKSQCAFHSCILSSRCKDL